MNASNAGALILVAEDDPSNSEVIASTLAEFGGYRVVTEANGEVVVARVEELRPDAVLLDLLLPRKNGMDILRDLRATAHFADLPIVAISADVRPGVLEQARALGCTEFVAKPFGIDQLLEAVERALQGRTLHNQPLDDSAAPET